MAPSKMSGEGLLQWAAGTRWGQGGWAALWKIFLSGPLVPSLELCSALQAAKRSHLPGQIFLPLDHLIDHSEPPVDSPPSPT